jgi:hypothetical protein
MPEMEKVLLPSDYWEIYRRTFPPDMTHDFRMLMESAFFTGGVAMMAVIEDARMAEPIERGTEIMENARMDLMARSEATAQWLDSKSGIGEVH